MYFLVDQLRNIVLGPQGCLFKLRTDHQKYLNQIKIFFSHSFLDPLYCPLRLKQLQLSVVEESTAKVSDRLIGSRPLSWSTHRGLGFATGFGALSLPE